MGTAGELLFIVCAAVAIVSAVMTVYFAHPLRAAMALLLHVVSLAGVYLTLSAHFLAAIQLLVYAGAVVVLFVFTIMLIGPAAHGDDDAESNARGMRTVGVRLLSALLTIFGVLAVAFVLGGREMPFEGLALCGPTQGAECGQFGGVRAVGLVLFKDAVVPFEIVSILLTVAIVGAVAVARGRNPKEVEAYRALRTAKEAEVRARDAELALAGTKQGDKSLEGQTV